MKKTYTLHKSWQFLMSALFLFLLAATTFGQTVTTDKADYAPGETVLISGTGWQAGETVDLKIEHLVFDHPDEFLQTVADAGGNIYTDEYVITIQELGETFLLTATGQSSGFTAETTFTDADGSINKVYQHWADGDATTGSSAEWNNNILSANKSDYFEGEVIPHVYVYKASNNVPLTNGASYSFNVTYNYYQQNTNAGGFAYMTTYNISRVPGPLNATNPYVAPSVDNSFANGGGTQGVFYTVDADITDVSGVTLLGTGTKDGYVTITFTYTGTTTTTGIAEIYYGLYIAQPEEIPDQGAGPTEGASVWTGGSLQTTVDIGGSGATSIQLNPAAIIRGEISGHKFSDLNNNGVWDEGELPLSGWTIELFRKENGSNIVLATDVTDENGYYFFSVTPDADKSDIDNDPYYTREVEDKPGWTRTAPAGDGSHGPLTISADPLIGQTSYTDLDFGNFFCTIPELDDATLTECADSPGGTTATFDLTTAATGVDPATMTIVYSDGSGVIGSPGTYSAANGATVTVTAYYSQFDESCSDQATITLYVDPVPDLSAASLTECADSPGGLTATFDLTSAATGVNPGTMTVVYTDGSGVIGTPGTYVAADGATVTVTAYFNASDESCTDQATITLNVDAVPDLSAASLTECADSPGGLTATFDLTSAATGVNTGTMTVVYSDGSGVIGSPGTYVAADGATVTVTAYFNASDESCTDQAIITLNVDAVPDLSAASLTECADLPGGLTATFDLTSAATGVNPGTMTVVYSDGSGVIGSPGTYVAADGATVTVTAYFNASDESCTDQAIITLNVDPVPDLSDDALDLCADEPGGTTATFDLEDAELGLNADMVVVYNVPAGTDINNYVASNGDQVTVTAYYSTSDESCTDQATITLYINPDPVCEITEFGDIQTYRGSEGFIDITVSGGTGPYEYLWSSPDLPAFSATTEDLTDINIGNLTDANFIVVITDAKGCQTTCEQLITGVALAPACQTEVTPVSCFNGSDGTINVFFSDFSGAVDIFLIDSDNNETQKGNGVTESPFLIGDLSEGNYTVRVEDVSFPNELNSECLAYVGEPAELVGSASATEILCYGETSTVTLSAVGGTGAYSYTFDGVTNGTGVFTGIPAGTGYAWSITDENECVDSGTLDIDQPAELVGSASATEILCYGETSTVTLSAVGGTGAYSYTFDGVTNGTGIFTGIPAGTGYAWSITDENQCVDSGTLDIDQPAELVGNAAATEILCYGETSTVTLSAVGGTGAYSYTFDGVTNGTGVFTGIPAGTGYAWSITDENECVDSGTLDIDQPAELVGSASATEILCYGETSTVTLSAVGGTGAYSYTFNGVTNGTGVFTGILAGTGYAWSITDDNECVDSGTLDIDQPSQLTCYAEEDYPASCDLLVGGAATVYPSGGTPFTEGEPYLYSWMDALNNEVGTTASVSNLPPGDYVVTVEDANGCTTTCNVTITRTPEQFICETAYGLLGDDPTVGCFINDGFDQWGWTNYITETETAGEYYTLKLWSGAGLCDLTKGTHVGNAIVTYYEGKVTVVYEMFEGYVLKEAHVYAGYAKYPEAKGKNGGPTVAPGQYTWPSGGLDNNNGITDIVIDGLGGPIYIIVHGVACEIVCIWDEPVVYAANFYKNLSKGKKSGDIASPEAVAADFKVYPNPFTSSGVTFEFTAPRDARAVLEITNMLGQLISTVMDEHVREGVLNRVEFRPQGVVPGNLIYRLRLGDSVQTGRLIYKE